MCHELLSREQIIREKYHRITKLLIRKGLTITTMESCTAGQIASLLTDTEGSSAIMKGAFITYSNEAKILQGVPEETIKTSGVYSEETARAMAAACRRAYHADIGIGITGTMGNVDPVNQDSTPGEVYFAIEISEKCDPDVCRGKTGSEKDTREKLPGMISRQERIAPQESRLAWKLEAADLVAEELLEMISAT